MGLNSEVSTPFRLITIETTLTKNGLQNYKKVLALILEFFRLVEDKWLADGPIDLFTESMTIA